MHFIIIVEGHTEHKAVGEFLGHWLNAKSRLRTRVEVKPVNLKGGGADLFKRIADRAGVYLTGPGADPKTIGVIGLLDLYNPSFDQLWPRNEVTKDERYAWAVDHVTRRVNHARFRMAFAVHEVEAWILSEPEKLHERVYRGLSNQDRARMGDPEAINFGRPPAKFLNALYQQHLGKKYKKRAYGSRLLRALDPEKAYQKCPHLARMLDEMLALAHQAGC